MSYRKRDFPLPQRILTNGYGDRITDPKYIEKEIYNYLDFDTAAPMIAPHWTRHMLHTEWRRGRVLSAQLLIIQPIEMPIDPQEFHGKKFYIHKDEVQRLKEEWETRPHRKIRYCQYGCGKQYYNCKRVPCRERVKDGQQYQNTLEKVAEYFTRFINRPPARSKDYSKLHRKTQSEKRRDSERAAYGGDNGEIGT